MTEIGNPISGISSATGRRDTGMSGSGKDTPAVVGGSQFHHGGTHGGHLHGRVWNRGTVLPSGRSSVAPTGTRPVPAEDGRLSTTERRFWEYFPVRKCLPNGRRPLSSGTAH